MRNRSISKNIERVEKLQYFSYEIYLHTIRKLKAGMSEIDITSLILEKFKENGVTNFWYDVPIMVLIGEERFLDMTRDYKTKSPSEKYVLKKGDTINVDFTPMDEEGYWGDFSATFVYQPKTDYDFEKVEFLKLMRKIQIDGIERITSSSTTNDIASWYLEKFAENEVTLVDARNNFGHSMHQGSKKYPDGREKRIFIDIDNRNPIGKGVFAIEPSGCKKSRNDKTKMLVGKFEDCIYVPENISTNGVPLLLIPNEEISFYTAPGAI